MKKANLIMLGAPGSGKGTRAVAICEVLGIVQVATGDLFRHNLKNNTELGKLAKSYMDKGELVPDDVTAAMVKDRLMQADTEKGFVLDGFPRTLKQAEMLDDMFKEMNREITAVVYLDVADEEIVKRISGRMVCEKCQAPYHKEYTPPKTEGVCDKCGGTLYTRDDDKPETVQKRLNVYRTTTLPLVDFYEKKNLIVKIPPELSSAGAVADMRELCKEIGLI
ncbi:MAG: adenylate kinase [Opitutales bacterium]|nr:adenylate kinase [Opitutales bacterium]